MLSASSRLEHALTTRLHIHQVGPDQRQFLNVWKSELGSALRERYP